MDLRQRTRRFCLTVISCAVMLRLVLAGSALDWKRLLPIYSETGQNVRFLSSSEKILTHLRESPPPRLPEIKGIRFAGADASLVELDYDCALRPDLEALTERPLKWDLASGEPRVLILHTHTTESYTKAGEDYEETANYRTLDEEFNMLSIGDAVAQILRQGGIGVIHDRQIHDYPSYNGSYVHARKSLNQLLEEYPTIQLVLDLHRDALEREGKQVRFGVETPEGATAQLMFVVGTDVTRKSHKNWEENLALALKLHILLERETPGIMRPLNLREQRFNQDLHPGALLVEVGSAGNSRSEALAAARKLGEMLVSFSKGTEGEKNVINH